MLSTKLGVVISVNKIDHKISHLEITYRRIYTLLGRGLLIDIDIIVFCLLIRRMQLSSSERNVFLLNISRKTTIEWGNIKWSEPGWTNPHYIIIEILADEFEVIRHHPCVKAPLAKVTIVITRGN